MMDFKITTTNGESSPVVDNNKRLKESWAEDQFPEFFFPEPQNLLLTICLHKQKPGWWTD